ncbi:PREDICTED: uncharacterized protein LOC108362883 [Rhagoletis zephyria]|uniref:uncharacterized protein LOC108362883 n=1 Tax=Rhagoletis zephyria TaxID=28612 RepID=UPI000811A21F|nr:PREDICTED: uncharacterized protein LOC108362883 [Rhagoletis zephyria]XP_036345560.1 uncharacterized protein LOC118754789 [Rhagoletis pomonella]XP_036345591.1 uncharacterized protein LOC118754825 [Rhagoletis pomonella]
MEITELESDCLKMPNFQGTSTGDLVKKREAIRKSTCRKNGANTLSSINWKNQPKISNAYSTNQQPAANITPDTRSKGNQNGRKYSAPQMSTVLRDVNLMENIEALRPPLFKNDVDLTPRSKATIAPKITQRLNFNAAQVNFKNLTPINVNDSILIQNQCNSNHSRLTKPNKVPSPELCHWLEPLPPLKHSIPEPEITLEFCDQEFDPFDCYLLLLNR